MVVLVLAVIVGALIGALAYKATHAPPEPAKPGFYCNGTTAVYYDAHGFQTVPFAGECGGVG